MQFFKALKSFKAISFDLDDTLYNNIPNMIRAESLFCDYLKNKYNIPYLNVEDLYSIRHKMGDKEPSLYDDVTYLRSVSLLKVFETLNCPLPGGYKTAYDLVQEFIKFRSDFQVPQSSVELLKDLKKKYRIIAISNGNVSLKSIGLDGIFECDLRPSLNSVKRKPFPDLFNKALDYLEIKPNELLHVGDDPITDVYGSICANVQCCCIHRGFVKKCAGIENFKLLPHVMLDNIQELRSFI